MGDKEQKQMIEAAFCYFCAWNRKDSKYCDIFDSSCKGWSEARVKKLKSAMAEYAIARGFSRKNEEDERPYEPVFRVIDAIEKVGDPVATVEECVEDLRKEYERNLLSAASKLLWFKFKSPIVIYDNLARRALNKDLTHGMKMREQDYAAYRKKWCADYKDKAPMIRAICEEHLVCIAPVASEQWFRERVFDRYLWHKGKAE